MANWAEIPPLAVVETTVTMSVCEDCAILDVNRTLTVYTGFVFDDDDGLPLSYPGERFNGHHNQPYDPYLYSKAWADVAEHKI